MKKIWLITIVLLFPIAAFSKTNTYYQKAVLIDMRMDEQVYTGGATSTVYDGNIFTRFKNKRVLSFYYMVKSNGMTYVGQYNKRNIFQANPGADFAVGAPVWVRFSGGKMYMKRPNGSDLSTRIVYQKKG